MKKNVVSLAYKSLPAPSLSAFLGWVITCMNGNPSFPNPPIPLVPPVPPDPNAPVDMTTRKANLDAAISASEGGGIAETAAKKAAVEVATDGLDALAFYVQTIARTNLPMLLTSGFQTRSTNHAQSVLDVPVILGIDNSISTQLDMHLSSITNAYGFEVQTSTNGTDWKTVKYYPSARSIVLTGLTSGTTYNVRARALGGLTGASDWSIPGSRIVT